MGVLESVNIARPIANPDKDVDCTGIDKRPVTGAVEVRDPGPRTTGLGSGAVGDYIGDTANHGGSDQALYAFTREDLDAWEQRLGRTLRNGFFGENLTTRDIDVNDSLAGERWQIGDTVVVEVTDPRIPCSTFRGWIGEKGWLKRFTEVGRPGAYLRIVVPGFICAGDEIVVVDRPGAGTTISQAYRDSMFG